MQKNWDNSHVRVINALLLVSHSYHRTLYRSLHACNAINNSLSPTPSLFSVMLLLYHNPANALRAGEI